MPSILHVLALCTGVVSAAVPPIYLGSNATKSFTDDCSSTVNLNSSTAGCPAVASTLTITPTYSGTYYDYSSTTVTTTTDTFTRIWPSYNATSTISSPGINPSTQTIYLTTHSTYTYPTSTSYSKICTLTSFESLESTSTVYTGTFSPSSVASYCTTSTKTLPHYIGGTIHTTVTSTSYPNPTFATSYIPAGITTITAYTENPSTTATVTLVTDVSRGVFTSVNEVVCTSTIYTATAASPTVTQAAKCASSNLITDVSYIQYYNNDQSFSDSQQTSDASSCCQICAENELCAAMNWSNGYCNLRIASVGAQCGVAERVIFGYYGFTPMVIQAGCGRIEFETLDY